MGDLSKHFSRSEFACNCGCGQDTVDAELIVVLEQLRASFDGAKITVNSGNRCTAYNKKIGGRPNSFHIISKAADIVVKGVYPEYVAQRLNEILDTGGIGSYPNFTHVDVRDKKARWVN